MFPISPVIAVAASNRTSESSFGRVHHSSDRRCTDECPYRHVPRPLSWTISPQSRTKFVSFPWLFLLLAVLKTGIGAILGIKEESRLGAVQAMWNYIKIQGLQDKSDRRLVRADDRLRGVCAQRYFSEHSLIIWLDFRRFRNCTVSEAPGVRYQTLGSTWTYPSAVLVRPKPSYVGARTSFSVGCRDQDGRFHNEDQDGSNVAYQQGNNNSVVENGRRGTYHTPCLQSLSSTRITSIRR